MTILENQIENLQLKLEKKESEIVSLSSKIHNLEDELLEFHEIIAEGISLKKIEELIESKYKFNLKSKENEMRELKNKMGFLRKENLNLIRELDTYTQKDKKSSVLSVEDIRFEKSLEEKNKKLKELEQKLEERDKKINYLNGLISEMKEERISKLRGNYPQRNVNDSSKKFTKEEFKKKIMKYKQKIKKLQNKLNEFEKGEKERIKEEIDLLDLKNTIPRLKYTIEQKDQRIKELEAMFKVSNSKK